MSAIIHLIADCYLDMVANTHILEFGAQHFLSINLTKGYFPAQELHARKPTEGGMRKFAFKLIANSQVDLGV